MKGKIKNYFENLDPKKLQLKKKIKVISVSRLGQGANNLNYLVKTNLGKFIFRLNADLKNKTKSGKEFNSLRIVKNSRIAPRAYLFDDSRKDFDSDFIILDYLDGELCTKVCPYFDEKMIRALAQLLSKIHRIKISNKMRKEFSCRFLDYESHINEMKDLGYIKKSINNKEFLRIIECSIGNLEKKILNKKIKSGQVLSQGDFRKGNIIVNNGKYFLIDFERLGITNKSSALAHIFVNFKQAAFTKKQQEIFLDEYKKHVKVNKEIEEEINNCISLMAMVLFLWSIEFTLKIKNKEMYLKFIEKSNHKKNVGYAINCFKRALKFGAIDNKYKNFNLYKVLI